MPKKTPQYKLIDIGNTSEPKEARINKYYTKYPKEKPLCSETQTSTYHKTKS